uniref:Uncharacterized protein n=1 Tax=Rhizophora mucronata TaxID=61149 RepID=A0A2P2J3N8_RHIMU
MPFLIRNSIITVLPAYQFNLILFILLIEKDTKCLKQLILICSNLNFWIHSQFHSAC